MRSASPLSSLACFLNLLFLGSFKYLDFLCSLAPVPAGTLHLPHLAFVLGISFFTITQIMYLVDCYEEMVEPSSLFDHATFVAFFPCVISGPICRAQEIIGQFPKLNQRQAPDADKIARAIYLFSIGLFKKVLLADRFAVAANYGFGNIASLNMTEAFVCLVFYAFQIYCDFSGYSDMAIASALMLNIDVPVNFDSPFRTKSLSAYWQHWHMTLTNFITTYLYTPILRSFNRATLLTSAIATILAMTIAGLWHGANWTYVVFGMIHGIGLAINQYWRRKKLLSMPHFFSWLLTFVWVNVGFLFFRADTLSDALSYLSHMLNPIYLRAGFNWAEIFGTKYSEQMFTAVQFIAILVIFTAPSSTKLAKAFKPTWLTCAWTTCLMLVSFLYLNSHITKPFVYFGF